MSSPRRPTLGHQPPSPFSRAFGRSSTAQALPRSTRVLVRKYLELWVLPNEWLEVEGVEVTLEGRVLLPEEESRKVMDGVKDRLGARDVAILTSESSQDHEITARSRNRRCLSNRSRGIRSFMAVAPLYSSFASSMEMVFGAARAPGRRAARGWGRQPWGRRVPRQSRRRPTEPTRRRWKRPLAQEASFCCPGCARAGAPPAHETGSSSSTRPGTDARSAEAHAAP